MQHPDFQQFRPILADLGLNTRQMQDIFIENATLKHLAKGALLAKSGEKNHQEFLLTDGIVHRFNHNPNGKPVTTGFYQGPVVLTPHFARTISGKSLFSLQAITDIILFEIPVDTLNQLRHTQEVFKIFGQKIVENALAQNLFNEIAFRSMDAGDRLRHLRMQFPNIENRIPHHIIASYLGITQVSFSRLRATVV